MQSINFDSVHFKKIALKYILGIVGNWNINYILDYIIAFVHFLSCVLMVS